jgi:hypothetical protein
MTSPTKPGIYLEEVLGEMAKFFNEKDIPSGAILCLGTSREDFFWVVSFLVNTEKELPTRMSFHDGKRCD